MVNSTKKEFGSFDIIDIPVIDLAAKLTAIEQDLSTLNHVRDIVNYIKELHPWMDIVDEAFDLVSLTSQIKREIETNPGCFQSSIIKCLFADDEELGREVLRLMEMLGIIIRKKKGNSYQLELVN